MEESISESRSRANHRIAKSPHLANSVEKLLSPRRADGESIYHQDGKRKPRRNEPHRASVRGKFDDASRRVFLSHYAQTAVLYKSAHAANLCAQTIRNRILKDTTFADEVEQAKQQYVELLESEVHRRGVVGIDEPIFYKGREVGTIKKYSDRMLALQVKRFCPEYGERIDVNASAKNTNLNSQIDLKALDDVTLEALEKLLSGDLIQLSEMRSS